MKPGGWRQRRAAERERRRADAVHAAHGHTMTWALVVDSLTGEHWHLGSCRRCGLPWWARVLRNERLVAVEPCRPGAEAVFVRTSTSRRADR